MMDRIEIKLASDDVDAKTGEFTGYGAVFGNVDSYGDVIAKGAFKTTLREWEALGMFPPMLLQHGGGGFGGNAADGIPIGIWTEMEENAKGLKVRGRLDPIDTDEGRKILAGLKNKTLNGLSIGYKVRAFTRGVKPSEPARTLEDIHLMEVSIVTFPANGKARVTGVKSLDAPLCRVIERALKTELNLSNADAVSAVAIVKKHLREGSESELPDLSRDDDGKALADMIRRNVSFLKG